MRKDEKGGGGEDMLKERDKKIKDQEEKSTSGIQPLSVILNDLQIGLQLCASRGGREKKAHNFHMLIPIMARQSNYQQKCQPCLSDRSQQEPPSASISLSITLYYR